MPLRDELTEERVRPDVLRRVWALHDRFGPPMLARRARNRQRDVSKRNRRHRAGG